MSQAAGEKSLGNFRILVAPLDWGLGHATRCIPIIRELVTQGCEVWLAGEGEQEALLRSEFPQLSFLPLEGYRIRYSIRGFTWKIISQIPRIVSKINQENRWLKRMVHTYHFDAVISDNRFGLRHATIPSIFITHQVSIKTNLGKWAGNMLQRWNYRQINQFTECWVPDTAAEVNLAGELSHPSIKPTVPLRYIGWLSRFRQPASSFLKQATNNRTDHLLFILSGPEPQRSILENKIIDDVSHYPGSATIVRGKPSLLTTIPSTGMIKSYNHLSAIELNEEMDKADLVISRSGYSTIMDIVQLQKKAILIPTPGQTEQEYLGALLNQKQIALSIEQKNFSLPAILDKAKNFNYHLPLLESMDNLGATINDFLSKLKG
jgi:hypothetical protein